MTTSSDALFTLGMLLIGNFSPTKVLLSHSSTPSTLIPSPDHNGYEPLHNGVTFKLGGVEKEMSLLEFGWRVGLYTERESRDVMTLSGFEEGRGKGVIMKLHEGEYWLGQLPEGLTKEVGEGGGGSEGDDEEAMEKGGNEELGGSLDITKT
ncbi:hypothetical protein Tco_0615501 [Tanacetum coccineum]